MALALFRRLYAFQLFAAGHPHRFAERCALLTVLLLRLTVQHIAEVLPCVLHLVEDRVLDCQRHARKKAVRTVGALILRRTRIPNGCFRLHRVLQNDCRLLRLFHNRLAHFDGRLPGLHLRGKLRLIENWLLRQAFGRHHDLLNIC